MRRLTQECPEDEDFEEMRKNASGDDTYATLVALKRELELEDLIPRPTDTHSGAVAIEVDSEDEDQANNALNESPTKGDVGDTPKTRPSETTIHSADTQVLILVGKVVLFREMLNYFSLQSLFIQL